GGDHRQGQFQALTQQIPALKRSCIIKGSRLGYAGADTARAGSVTAGTDRRDRAARSPLPMTTPSAMSWTLTSAAKPRTPNGAGGKNTPLLAHASAMLPDMIAAPRLGCASASGSNRRS